MNVIFWHICGLSNYKKIVTDQFNSIKRSGFLDKVDKIYITYLGRNKNDINFLLKKSNKITLHVYDTYIYHYERLCLHALHDFAQLNDANVLYIHAKGVSARFIGNYTAQESIKQWRKMMEYFLIYQHQSCIKLLETHDALGCCLHNNKDNELTINNEDHAWHFSGNFWWSTSKYIRTLPRIREDIVGNLAANCTFHLCERWILQRWPDVKYIELYKQQDTSHFYDCSPNLCYLNVDLNKLISC